jgi:hypothetical protein
MNISNHVVSKLTKIVAQIHSLHGSKLFASVYTKWTVIYASPFLLRVIPRRWLKIGHPVAVSNGRSGQTCLVFVHSVLSVSLIYFPNVKGSVFAEGATVAALGRDTRR